MLHYLSSGKNFVENCLIHPFLTCYIESAFETVWTSTFTFQILKAATLVISSFSSLFLLSF